MAKKVIVVGDIAAAALLAPLAVRRDRVRGRTGPGPGPGPGPGQGNRKRDVGLDQGRVTGPVKFDANNKTGGSLDYHPNNGLWLHGVVTPGSYQKIDAHTAVFAGEITSGSDDDALNHEGADCSTTEAVTLLRVIKTA